MRIACVTSSWPSREQPLAGNFVREHAQLLEAAGHEITVFTWRPGTYDDDVVVVAPLGNQSVFAGAGAPDTLDVAPWKLFEGPVAVAAMLRELGRHPPFDLYLGHWLVPGGLVARLAGDALDRRSFVVGHSAGVHLLSRMPSTLREPLLDEIVRPGSTTVPSFALARKLGREVDVLPMGFHPVDVASNGDGVLLYGRLVDIKGFDTLAPLVASLGLELHIAGSGPQEPLLRELAPEATFWGFADAALKREVFSRCGRALFGSRSVDGRHEGWPLSVLEVASAGVVPFVADWPGADELVPAGQVVSGSTEAWTQACLTPVEPLRTLNIEHARLYSWSALQRAWRTQLESPVAQR